MTRQDAADRLVSTGLDQKSLVAILQAISTAEITGWGVVTILLKDHQITGWKIELTEKVERGA